MKRKNLAFVLALAMVVSSIPQQNVMRASASDVQVAEGSTEAGSEEAVEVVPPQEENLQLVETELPVAISETEAPVIVTEAPETEATVIVTEAPETEAPVIVTEAPETEAPVIVTEAPETEPPVIVTEAPETEAPVIVTEAPETEAPVIVTEAPETGEPVTDTETSVSEASQEEIEIGSEQQTDEAIVIVEEPGNETEEATKALEDMLDFQILDTELKWLANTPEAIEFAQDLWTFETTCEGTEGTENTHLFDQTENGFAVTIASIADVNGTLYGYDQAIPEGDYVITFSFGNTVKEYPLSAVDFKDYGEPLNLQETAVMGEGYHYYTFMPSKTGNFCVSQTAGSYWMYDESLNQLPTGIVEETGELYYELEEGKPYLIAASVPEEIGTAELSLKELEVEEVLEEQETEELLMADDGVLTVGEEIQLEEGNYTFSFTPEKDGCYYFFNTNWELSVSISNEENEYVNMLISCFDSTQNLRMVYHFEANHRYNISINVPAESNSKLFAIFEYTEKNENLVVGENTFNGQTSEVPYYSIFEPTESGYYGIKLDNNIWLSIFNDENSYIELPAYFETGKKYICFEGINSGNTWSATIEKIPVIKNIELIGEPFITTSMGLGHLRFRVEYEDGSIGEIRYGEDIVYYGSVKINILDQETNEVIYSGPLEEGKGYLLRCSFGLYEQEFAVTAKDIYEHLALGQEYLQEEGITKSYTFTPEKDGCYYYINQNQNLYIDVSENGAYYQNLRGYGDAYMYAFKAGHTYEFHVRSVEGRGTQSFCLDEYLKLSDLKEGDNFISIQNSQEGYAFFEPMESAYYGIKMNQDGDVSIYDFEDSYIGDSGYLEKGKKYICFIRPYSENGVTVTMQRIPQVSDFELVGDAYVTTNHGLGNIRFNVEYEDGTSDELYYGEVLEFYGRMEAYLADKETGIQVPRDAELQEGKEYTLNCTLASMSKSFTVTAKPVVDVYERIVLGEKYSLEKGRTYYYSFTPEGDGCYYYYFHLNDKGNFNVNISVYDKEGTSYSFLTSNHLDNQLYQMIYYFEAENTYEFRIQLLEESNKNYFEFNEMPKYGELKENNNTDIMQELGYVLFRPEESGNYKIESNESYIYIYDSEGGDYIGKTGYFENGKTYICLVHSWDEQETIAIKRIPAATDITLVSKPYIRVGSYTGDAVLFDHLRFKISYDNGTFEELHAYDYSQYDGMLNVFIENTEEISAVGEELKEDKEYLLACDLGFGRFRKKLSVTAKKPADLFEPIEVDTLTKVWDGEYRIFIPEKDGVYKVKMTDINNYTLVIENKDFHDIPNVDSEVYYLKKNTYYYVRFNSYNASTVGTMVITSIEEFQPGTEKNPEEDSFCYELKVTEPGNYKIVVGEDINCNFYSSKEGWIGSIYDTSLIELDTETCYWISGDVYGEGDWKITFDKAPEIIGMEWAVQPIEKEFLENYDTIDFSDYQIKLSYANGTEQIIPLTGKDSYGYQVNYSIYHESDQEHKNPLDEWDLSAGNYIAVVEVRGHQLTFRFSVISVQNAVATELLLGQTSKFMAEKEYEVFKFQPEKDGKFEFTYQPRIRNFDLWDEEMNPVNVAEKNQFIGYVTKLEKNKIYYGVIDKGAQREVSASVNEATELQSITVSTKQKQFIAGLEYLTPGAIEVDTTYQDGQKSKLQGIDSDNRGTTCTYILDKDGEEYLLNEDLPIGEYQLVAKAYGDPDIQDSTTIWAVAVNAGNLPEALEGQETTAVLNTTGITLYRFNPGANGEYTVDLGDRSYVDGRFYEQTEQGLERVDELIAGTTYLLDISSLAENEGQQAVRFKIISEKEASEGWETSSGGNLELNKETELVFRYAWDEVKYLFTPEESGNYTFRGIFTDENVSHGADIDIYEVDDAGEEHDYIGGCYGNVNNGQIGCTVELEKAKTYVCYIYSHENYSKMLFSVKKTPDNKVESIKIERKNNESEMVEMINPFDEQSFLFTIYYEDGDYDIEERSYLEEGTVETWTDIYGNQWQYQYSVTSENDTEKIYLLQMTGNGFSTEERFTEKKMSSLNAVELTEGQTFTQTFQSGESILNYYRITPKEDGEYALKLIPKQGEGFFQGVSIFKNGEERIWSYSQENANIRIRNLEKGQTYYLVMPIAEAENFQYSVSFEKAKTVAGIELIQDSTVIPADSYWLGEYVKDLHIQLTYADGTALTMKDGFETADGYGNSLELLEKSAGDDKIQITVFAEDYWDSKIYTIDRSQVKPITSGQTIAVPATWKDQAVYLFSVEQSGLYSLDVQNGEISAALFDSQHKEQLSADTTWSLEGGTSYYLHVYCMPNGANASYTLTKRSHTFGEWKVMSEATCTENGIRYRSCTDADCGYYDTEEVPALGHSFEEKSIEPTDTETGMRYQECTRCHRVEVLEILPITIPEVDTVIDQIEKLPDNAAQDEIKNAADAVAAIENEKLENGGAMDSIKALEEKAVTAQLAGNTQVEGILGLQVEGAGLTVLQYEEKLQGDTGAAKVSIVQSATDYSGHEELGGTKLYALDISMDIVNEKTNATVEENVEPITPIRITLDLPEEYQGKSFELYHMGTAGLEKVDYLMNPEQTQITFTTSSLSDFILKLTDCQGEHQYQENIVTNATCTAEGSKQMVCENCGYEKTEVIPPTGKHAYETIIDKDPTCGASGSQHEECMICHYARPAVNIPATGKHTWTTKVDQAATCGAAGSQHKECTVCGQKEGTETIPATGAHSWTTKVDKAATCGAAGSRHQECTVCGQKEGTETIPATGAHSWTTKVDKAATCGAAGSQHKECSVCGQKQAAETIPATGAHTWTTKVDQAATCGAAGSQHKECTVCGQRQAAEAIPATGAHHYVTTISKEATCGEAGRKYEECTVCHSQKGAETIPATNAHKFGSYKVTKEATVLAEGTKTRTCSVCGEEENVSIKKLRAKISLNVKKIPLKVKQSTTKVEVTYGKGDKIVSWKSSNRKVATVTSKGKITGKKAGKATITVKLKSGKSAKITVTVQKNKVKTTKLKLNKKSLTLKKGKKYQLNAAVTPVTSQEKVKFTSSNKKILTVSSKGKITAKKKGTAYVVVTSGSKTVRCKVKVK